MAEIKRAAYVGTGFRSLTTQDRLGPAIPINKRFQLLSRCSRNQVAGTIAHSRLSLPPSTVLTPIAFTSVPVVVSVSLNRNNGT